MGWLVDTPHCCGWRWHWTFDNFIRRMIHPPQKVLGEWVRPGMTVLDAGCGIGHFSLGMAHMVGKSGRVIAADVQQGALDTLMRRAKKQGVDAQIQPWLCNPTNLSKAPRAEFVLSFWMLHETADADLFTQSIAEALQPGGLYLLAEPKGHTSERLMDAEIGMARDAGLTLCGTPSISLCRSALFTK